MSIIGRLMIMGDPHLYSKGYGAHSDYPRESLEYMQTITDKMEELGVTHFVGAGDFTFGRFTTVEYREAVDAILKKQYDLTKGNRYELKGNHDKSSHGKTEYDYYVNKGLIKASENIKIGNLDVSMIDYRNHLVTDIIPPTEERISLVIAHDYFKFENTQLPDYGKAHILDQFTKWFGVSYLVCGHIHGQHMFEGYIQKDEKHEQMVVMYPGCPMRPAYREGHMESNGMLYLFTAHDTGEVVIDQITFPLWPIEKAFNLDEKTAKKELKAMRKVDVTDVVKNLTTHTRGIGDPESLIMGLETIDMVYRKKAVDLLHEATK